MGTAVSYISFVLLSILRLNVRQHFLRSLIRANSASAVASAAAFYGSLCLALTLMGCRRAAPTLPALPEAPAQRLSVLFLGLEGGESALVQTAGGGALLIDAGSEEDAPAFQEALRRRGVTRLIGAVATHPDPAHVGGMAALLAAVPAQWLMDSGFPDLGAPGTSPELARSAAGRLARRLIDAAAGARGVEYRLGRAGQTIPIEAGVTLEVLAPGEPFLHGTGRDADNAAIVLRLVHGKVRVLFTGDMGSEEAERILASPQARWLSAEVLQVSDRGSALQPGLLRRIRPRLVVTTGPARTPPEPAVALLKKWGAAIHAVPAKSALLIASDGKRFTVQTGAASSGSPSPGGANSP
jgi:beta-lactamase superfamily II metal-dependent hydrolase